MTTIPEVLAAFDDIADVRAEWIPTGGGCHAIAVHPLCSDVDVGPHVLVTGVDVYDVADYHTIDNDAYPPDYFTIGSYDPEPTDAYRTVVGIDTLVPAVLAMLDEVRADSSR